VTPLEQVRERLERADCNPRGAGEKFEARCPAHQDRNPSLSVGLGREGQVILCCHAGCETPAILDALNLSFEDLHPEDSAKNGRRELVATYDYTDKRGKVRYQVCRFIPKAFPQRRPDGAGGWIWGLDGIERVLYRLPAVIAAVAAGEPIYVAEGEKDALVLEAAGVVATCNPEGAGKWRDEYAEPLRGAIVKIIADKDGPGRDHARDIERSLQGVAGEVSVVEAAVGKDAADHLAAGRGLGDFKPMGADAERVSTNASSIPPRRIRWAWKGRLALGYLSLWSGESSLGKSVFACWIIAALSRGQLEGRLEGEATRTLIVAQEDAREDMWVPRLMAAKADLTLVDFLDQPLDWNLHGMDLVATALEQSGARFVLIDSVLEVMPETKGSESSFHPMYVRRALRPFGELCRERHVAGLISTHPPKTKGTTFADHVISSAAFVHVTRVGLLFAWHPDDVDLPDQERRRVMLRPPGGSNIGRDPGAHEFRVQAAELLIEDKLEEVPYIEEFIPSDVTYRDLIRVPKDDTPTRTQAAEARVLIDERLADGKWHPSMLDELIELGYSKSTVYRAAAPCEKHKAGESGWWWAKPGTSKDTFVEPDGNMGTTAPRARTSSHDGNNPPKTPENGSTERSSQLPAESDEPPPAHEASSQLPTLGTPRAHAHAREAPDTLVEDLGYDDAGVQALIAAQQTTADQDGADSPQPRSRASSPAARKTRKRARS
jgi:putative DNA primase/helicase